nr:MAG: RNA-dependent RNA polymerase [Sanya mito-like virus 2]
MTVQYAAHLVGKYPTDQYILLGDDIVIYDDSIAESYRSIVNQLGVEISPIKTHVSKDTYEFAKRWFRSGVEFSGIPLNGIRATLDNPTGLFEIVKNLVIRGYHSRTSLAETTAYISLYLNHNKRKFLSLRNRLDSYNVVTRNLIDFNYDEVRNFIAKATNNNEYHIPLSEKDLKKEFLRVINAVYGTKFASSTRQILTYHKDMIKTVSAVFFKENTEDAIVMQHPLIISLENKIMSIAPMQAIQKLESEV